MRVMSYAGSLCVLCICLFFSSRRRHTRCYRDWSSDVCSSDLFGLAQFTQLKNLPVHRAMREISELIYETCKTYLLTQGRFLLILWVFIGAIVAVYFGTLAQTVTAAGVTVRGFPAMKVIIILLFRLIGIAGSYGVAWFGIR